MRLLTRSHDCHDLHMHILIRGLPRNLSQTDVFVDLCVPLSHLSITFYVVKIVKNKSQKPVTREKRTKNPTSAQGLYCPENHPQQNSKKYSTHAKRNGKLLFFFGLYCIDRRPKRSLGPTQSTLPRHLAPVPNLRGGFAPVSDNYNS